MGGTLMNYIHVLRDRLSEVSDQDSSPVDPGQSEAPADDDTDSDSDSDEDDEEFKAAETGQQDTEANASNSDAPPDLQDISSAAQASTSEGSQQNPDSPPGPGETDITPNGTDVDAPMATYDVLPQRAPPAVTNGAAVVAEKPQTTAPASATSAATTVKKSSAETPSLLPAKNRPPQNDAVENARLARSLVAHTKTQK